MSAVGAPMTIWRMGREDFAPLALIAALPLAAAAPQLLGFLQADPMLYTAAMTLGAEPGIFKGMPFIDPNSGFSTQALGRLAALQWLEGTVPWWNHYSGVGLPLGAEYHPAAFFPLTLLLLLPKGMVLMQIALQLLAGAGTYGLLRQTGAGRLAATVGGVLYAFNGTLAWFSHAAAQPVAFLPWMLWGIERAFATTRAGLAGGWRMLGAAMAMSLLAGFPETAYINGLLALGWTLVRGAQLPGAQRASYAGRIAAGGFAGIAVAAPQVYAFFEFLLQADLGGHEHRFEHEAMGWSAILPSLVAPYVFGPIFAYIDGRAWLHATWGGIGGYATLALVVTAAFGWWTRRGAIGWLLLAWCVLALARTFGVELAATLWNLVPGISLAAFYRYAPPSWELALVIMAAWGVDALSRGPSPGRAWMFAGLVLAAGIATAVVLGNLIWPAIHDGELRRWTRVALAWAGVTAIACVALARRPGVGRARALAAVLMADALIMFTIPTLSNPRAGAPDIPAIHFLRNNLGLQRFFTLGPIQPNYGAYFRIASINYNYLPNSRRWHLWVRDHLDRDADSVVFNGTRVSGPSAPADELRRNLAAYQWVGVKYVVAFPSQDPLAGIDGVRPVYADASLRIFELPAPKPYFEAAQGRCALLSTDRSRVVADCAAPDTLVRRELFHPGWTARAGDRGLPIGAHRGLFQSVELPAGRSEVGFDYAPPHVGWAWLVALAGLLAFAVPSLRRARRSAPRNRSAT